MSKRWYVVHAYSGFEATVKRSLEERIERAGVQELFGDILVPTEEVVEMRGGTQRRSERKFFPGYVLVQMEMTDEAWHLVKDVPKVMGFIGGTGDRPAPITDREADQILNRMQDGVDKPKPKVLFEPGEDGPCDRWSVQRLQWLGRRSGLRKESPEGVCFDLRSFYPSRSGIWSGRENLIFRVA